MRIGLALGAASTPIHRLTDTVWTVELVGRCSLDYHTAPTRTVALACPGMDYLRLWPWPPVPLRWNLVPIRVRRTRPGGSARVSLMSTTEAADRVITQGHALVRAIEALGTIEATGHFEQAVAGLLATAYRRRLRRSSQLLARGWASGY